MSGATDRMREMKHYTVVINGETVFETDDFFEAYDEACFRVPLGQTIHDCIIETEVE